MVNAVKYFVAVVCISHKDQNYEGLLYYLLFPFRLIGPGFTLKDLESVPFGVALPIREAIYHCREQPCSDWSEEVCLLIGRQDLTKQAHKMTLAKHKPVRVYFNVF